MPVYTYRTRDIKGRLYVGTVEAASDKDVAENLRHKGLYVIDIKPKTDIWARLIQTEINLSLTGRKVQLKELAVFCRQLATLINAGIPLIGALNIIIQQAENKALREALQDVEKNLKAGNTLAVSFARHRNVFPEIFIYMVEAGEVGGVLDEVLQRMAWHFEREYEMNEKIKAALTYPKIVLAFTVLAGIFLLSFVLPNIISVVEGIGMPLPLPTKIVMSLSNSLINYWYWIILAVLLLCLTGFLLKKWPAGKQFIDRINLRLPIFGLLKQKIIIARFARTFATLYRGGVPIITALELVKKSTGNSVVAAAINQAQQNVQQGSTLSEPLESCSVFPPMVVKMIAIGEETGNLDILLAQVGDFYDREVNLMTDRLTGMLEPVLIVLLGGIVGFVVLAVLLPLMQSMSLELA